MQVGETMIKTYIYRNAYDLAFNFKFCLIFIIEQNDMLSGSLLFINLTP